MVSFGALEITGQATCLSNCVPACTHSACALILHDLSPPQGWEAIIKLVLQVMPKFPNSN